MPVARRFVVEQNRTTTSLQFGHGSESSIINDEIVNPNELILDKHGKNYVTDKSFDPTNLISNDKMGIVPANTTLQISYLRNSGDSSNSAVNTVVNTGAVEFIFTNIGDLNPSVVNTTKASLECNNEEPILGFSEPIDSRELKQRVFGSYSSRS